MTKPRPPTNSRAALYCTSKEEQNILSRMLTDDGWQVTEFIHEHDFICSHYAQPFEAVFIFISGAAGQEAAIRARARSSDCALIWGSDDHDFARSAYRIQATDFLVYPCSKERLKEAVKRCRPQNGLNRKQPPD